MKKRILAIILAIALLSSVAAVVAYAAGGTCSKCKTTFTDDAAYNAHVASCNYEQCGYCGQYFSPSAIANHESVCEKNPANVTPAKEYTCTECGQVFETADDLKAHYEQRHTDSTNALHCPYCNFIAPNISAYNEHISANHQKDGEQVTPRDNIERFFDKYVMGICLNVDTNSFSSVVRIFAYVTEVFMSVFTASGASEVFQFAGDSGVTYFFETIVPHFWAIFTGE